MKHKKRIVFFTLFICTISGYFAQVSVKDSCVFAPMVSASYAVQAPGADMAKRFGVNSAVGLHLFIKTKKNWLWGVTGDFMFGNQVRENHILDSITTSDGFFISNNGKLVDKQLSERGFTVFLKFGKVFSVLSPNPNSGIMAMAGVGFMEHHIRIDLVDGNSVIVPQMTDQLKKGYDRLSNGIAFTQFLGYLYLSNNRITNFFAGFELTEGITQNRRTIDYDQMKHDNSVQNDLLYSFRVGWILPLYKRLPKQFYEY